MGILLLTLRDLGHRRVRFAVVTLLGAIVFALLFVLSGLVEQFEREPQDAVDAVGAASWTISASASGPFNGLSVLEVDEIERLDAPAGARLDPIVISHTRLFDADDDARRIVLLGVTLDGLGMPPIVAGRAVATDRELVIDRSAGIEIGETVRISGLRFEVVGHSADTTMLAGFPITFVSLGAAQDLTYPDRTFITGVLSDTVAVDAPPDLAVMTADEVVVDTRRPLQNAASSVDLVRGLLWMISAIIIGAVVYLSALERQRDFAVLKAIGASTRTLLASLTIQAVLIALAAVAVGAVLQLGVVPSFPLRVRVPDRAFWQVPLIAVAVAVLASIAGLRKVATSDPLAAFGGADG